MTPQSFFNFPLMTGLKNCQTPLFLTAGDIAHSRYYSEDVAKIASNAELVIVEGADHCALYDKKEFIPFDKITDFFKKELKK